MPAPQTMKAVGTPNRPMPKGRAIDPIRVLRRHWKGIPIFTIIGGVLGVGAFLLFSSVYPLYTSDVMFEVKPGVSEATDIGTVDTSNDKTVERVQATQVYLIRDRGILTTAVQDRTMLQTIWLKSFIDPVTGVLLVDDAVDELEEELRTPIKKGTNLYGISWSGHVASDVPIVLNAIAASYLSRVKELDNEIFRQNEKLFDEEGENIRLTLQDVNDELQAFIRKRGITTLDDTRFSQDMFEIQQLTTELTNARSSLSSTQQSYLQVAAKLDGTLEPTMEDRLSAERDPIIARQMQTLEALQANLRALRERLSPAHPQVLDAEVSVRATEDQIAAKMDEIIRRNLNASLKDLSDRQEQLTILLESTEQEIEKKDAGLRELASDQSQFEHMISSRKQLEKQRDDNLRLVASLRLMKLRADASRVRRATQAQEPREKSFPKIEYMVPAGVFLCCAAFVGIVFLRELTDQKIRSASDVLIIPGAKVAGVLPDVEEDPEEIETPELALYHQGDGVFAESCRQAWAGIDRTLQRSSHQSLLVLAAAPEAGTTTVIGNFAVAATASGLKVAVVDCNFRRPRAASMFGYDDASQGVADLLTGSVDLETVTHKTDSGVSVISAGTPANRLYQRLGSERMKSVLAQLRSAYDLVLIDAPPSIVAGDAILLANLVDAITLVVRSDRDERGLIARVLRELSESRSEVLGITLNAAKGTTGGYFRKNYLAMVNYAQQAEGDEDE
ncbi:MAG: AAA family ATPase [Phycisphaerales bacterium]|nr:AAA family ATPase [Phycisphaerales bacterium]